MRLKRIVFRVSAVTEEVAYGGLGKSRCRENRVHPKGRIWDTRRKEDRALLEDRDPLFLGRCLLLLVTRVGTGNRITGVPTEWIKDRGNGHHLRLDVAVVLSFVGMEGAVITVIPDTISVCIRASRADPGGEGPWLFDENTDAVGVPSKAYTVSVSLAGRVVPLDRIASELTERTHHPAESLCLQFWQESRGEVSQIAAIAHIPQTIPIRVLLLGICFHGAIVAVVGKTVFVSIQRTSATGGRGGRDHDRERVRNAKIIGSAIARLATCDEVRDATIPTEITDIPEAITIRISLKSCIQRTVIALVWLLISIRIESPRTAPLEACTQIRPREWYICPLRSKGNTGTKFTTRKSELPWVTTDQIRCIGFSTTITRIPETVLIGIGLRDVLLERTVVAGVGNSIPIRV
jgi:hypothetical protein